MVFWASSSKAVLARRQLRLGCLVLKEQTIPTPTDNPAVHAALLKVGEGTLQLVTCYFAMT